MTSAPIPPPVILDLRPSFLYTIAHIPSSTHFPGLSTPTGLQSRLHELPAPSPIPHFLILASTPSEAISATQLLLSRGYTASVADFVALKSIHGTESGATSRPLWSPSPLVSATLPTLLSTLSPPLRTALDIGAGAGRDAAYLARHGFRVLAVERDGVLCAKAAALGRREGRDGGMVSAETRTFGQDGGRDREWLREHAAMVLVVVRFLRRGVLEGLHEGVLRGGFVVYEHFLTGCEEFGGPRKKSQMLEMGELGRVFSAERGFRVIRDDAERLADGRPVARFVARRDLERS